MPVASTLCRLRLDDLPHSIVYRIAYGMTIGPNGTISIRTPDNGTATLTAPPGRTVSTNHIHTSRWNMVLFQRNIEGIWNDNIRK